MLTELENITINMWHFHNREQFFKKLSVNRFLSFLIYDEEGARLLQPSLYMIYIGLCSCKPVSFDTFSPAGWKMVRDLQEK